MENIENVKLFVKSLDNSVDQLEDALKPVLKKSLAELVAENSTTPFERIKLYNNSAYTLISVIYSYLKTAGVDTDKHPISQELTRIRAYMKRAKELESSTMSKEQEQKNAEAKAKDFLQKTLGSKINGGGAAATANMTSPAISASNFQGKHTKFKEDKNSDSEPESFRESNNSVAKSKTKSIKSKTTKSGKVTKPRKNVNKK